MASTTLPRRIFSENLRAIDNKNFLLNSLKKSLHMSRGEFDLLSYYASKSAGFSPACKTIEQDIGMSKRQILRNRKALIDDGIISIDSSGNIILDWGRIRTLASLNPLLTGKHQSLCTGLYTEKCHHTIYNSYSDFDATALAPIDELVQILGYMTEKQYADYRKWLKR